MVHNTYSLSKYEGVNPGYIFLLYSCNIFRKKYFSYSAKHLAMILADQNRPISVTKNL